ncbi:MAG: hypothetical protein ACK56F_22190, partial [bacterium]
MCSHLAGLRETCSRCGLGRPELGCRERPRRVFLHWLELAAVGSVEPGSPAGRHLRNSERRAGIRQ